jgi:CelD/BcsL family acetyltransferase involved in cellulose biosynthesis
MRCAEKDGYRTSRWPTLLSPYVSLPTNPSDPFSNCPKYYKKDRKRLEKRFDRLKEIGEPTFHVYSHFDEDLFNEFIALEGSGWKGQAGGAIKCSQVLVDFYRELVKTAAQQGHLRMCALRAGGKAVAMELAFVVDGCCYSPKIAYDETLASSSPGQQLARLAIEDLVRLGVTKYDLLGPRSRYKAVWAGDIRPHANCYIFRPSIAGKVCYYIIDKIGPRIKRAKYARYGDPQEL